MISKLKQRTPIYRGKDRLGLADNDFRRGRCPRVVDSVTHPSRQANRQPTHIVSLLFCFQKLEKYHHHPFTARPRICLPRRVHENPRGPPTARRCRFRRSKFESTSMIYYQYVVTGHLLAILGCL